MIILRIPGRMRISSARRIISESSILSFDESAKAMKNVVEIIDRPETVMYVSSESINELAYFFKPTK